MQMLEEEGLRLARLIFVNEEPAQSADGMLDGAAAAAAPSRVDRPTGICLLRWGRLSAH